MKNSRISSNLELVSVIIPVYNGEVFIAETLDSVLSQTYKNLEIVVVDDGSEDKTVDIVRSFIKQDRRIILLSQANAGVAAARNLAIENSHGEFIAPLDADDIWNPTKIAKQVECIKQAGEFCGLVYTWSIRINEFGSIISKDRTDNLEGLVYPALAYCNFVGNASVPLIKRKCLEKVGNYNIQFKLQNAQGCEDWDLYFRIAEYYEYRVVPEFLMCYRITSQSMSHNFGSMLKSYFLVRQYIKSRHPKIPNKIYRWSEAKFYLHFASQSILAKQYTNYLRWWIKAILTDYTNLLSFQNYRIFIINLLGLQKFALYKQIKYTEISNHKIYFNLQSKNKYTPSLIINDRRWKLIEKLCKNASK